MSEELDQLAIEAAALDAGAAAQQPEFSAPGEAAPGKSETIAAEVAALLVTTAAMLAPMFPSLASIYTEATCQRLGEAAAPVMEKYNLSVGGLFDRWGAEITLAATALPVGIATLQGIKADLAARNKEKAEPAPDTAAAPAAQPMSEGAPGNLVIRPA